MAGSASYYRAFSDVKQMLNASGEQNSEREGTGEPGKFLQAFEVLIFCLSR